MGTPQVMQNGASSAPERAEAAGSVGAAPAEKSSWAISWAGEGTEGGSGGRSCPWSVAVTCSSTPGSVGCVRSPVV